MMAVKWLQTEKEGAWILANTKGECGGWCSLCHASKDKGETNMCYKHPSYTELVGDVSK